MRRLRMDFAMNRGHEMTIDREDGISRNELDELELHMLRSQRIPYLLPLDWYEIDGKITFRYELTGTKMAIHRLQQDMLTMEQYYSLILTLTDALMECKEYMLRPEGCLLNEQFMFMGERFGDLRLVYLPLKDRGDERHHNEDLLSLAVRWTSYVEPIDGTGLKRVLQMLQHNRSSLAELRETLLDLIAKESSVIHRSEPARFNQSRHPLEGESSSASHPSDDPMYSNRIQRTNQPSAASLWPSPQQQSAEVSPMAVKRLVEESKHNEAGTEDDSVWPYDDEDHAGEGRDDKRKWIAGAAFVLVAACIWRFIYMDQPTQQNLLISSGLTLFGLAGAILAMKKGTSLFTTRKEPMEPEEDFEPHSSVLPSRFSWSKPASPEPNDLVPATTESMGSYSIPAVKPAMRSEMKQPLPPTAVLGANDQDHSNKTVMLGTSARSAWLSRTWNGKEEQIALTANSFKIGRTSEGVGYADHAEGVSRFHLEIERIDGEHQVKDLGSRNGSLLNGKLMVPYKTYKLEFGDRIHLAGDKGPLYELKTGS